MPEELSSAYVVFAEEPTTYTPGRLRLRLPQERHNTSLFERLLQEIGGIEGVLEVSSRPHTGSILLHYSGSTDDVLSRLVALGLFMLRPRGEMPDLRGSFPKLDAKERAVVEGGIYLILSAIQLYRGKALGAGTSLLGQAIESLRVLVVEKELAPDSAQDSILRVLARTKS